MEYFSNFIVNIPNYLVTIRNYLVVIRNYLVNVLNLLIDLSYSSVAKLYCREVILNSRGSVRVFLDTIRNYLVSVLLSCVSSKFQTLDLIPFGAASSKSRINVQLKQPTNLNNRVIIYI